MTEVKHRIAIVTGIPTAPCTNPYGDYLLSLSIQNKQDYARLHSYEVHLMAEAVTSHIRAGPWQKIGFIQKVLCSSQPSTFLALVTCRRPSLALHEARGLHYWNINWHKEFAGDARLAVRICNASEEAESSRLDPHCGCGAQVQLPQVLPWFVGSTQ